MIRALSALTSTVLARALRWCSLDVNASTCLGRRGAHDGAPAPRELPTRLFGSIATVILEFALVLLLSPAASLWMAQSVPEADVNSCLPIERAPRERFLVPSLSEGLCRQKSDMSRCLTSLYVRRALQA